MPKAKAPPISKKEIEEITNTLTFFIIVNLVVLIVWNQLSKKDIWKKRENPNIPIFDLEPRFLI